MTMTTMTVFYISAFQLLFSTLMFTTVFCLPKTQINVHFTLVAFFILNQCGWLTRPHLSCHIWKLIMQLGQPQPAFANWEKSSVGLC